MTPLNAMFRVSTSIDRGAEFTSDMLHKRLSFADPPPSATGAGASMSLWLESGLHLVRNSALSALDMATCSLPLGVLRAPTGMHS
ncbi:hypothetical protein EVAR_68724_1 [Eumeta japonica]|uniref:Uncharacterized protein n=1 Tax=Eumeta variegata TaxID=151549 RepID=A0A4C2A133_EUMVA|nr:hypothetical protein EVAR_68724_1 [Eumeta japonica]